MLLATLSPVKKRDCVSVVIFMIKNSTDLSNNVFSIKQQCYVLSGNNVFSNVFLFLDMG